MFLKIVPDLLAVLRNSTLLAIVLSRFKIIQEQTRSLHRYQAFRSLDIAYSLVTDLSTNPILFFAKSDKIIYLFQLLNPEPLNLTKTN